MRRGSRRRSHRLAGAAWVLLALPMSSVFLVQQAAAQTSNAAKIVHGKVLDGSGRPLPGAIVYLQDQKSNVVKTFISTDTGEYRFGQLPADSDYLLWARYKDTRSKDKQISSFDTKLDVTHDFKLDVAK